MQASKASRTSRAVRCHVNVDAWSTPARRSSSLVCSGPRHGPGQRRGVPAVHHGGQPSRDLEQRRVRCHHHRDPSAHRLHGGKAEALVVGREDDQRGGRELPFVLEVKQPRLERHEVPHAPRRRTRFEDGAPLSRKPHHDERQHLGARAERGPGVEHEVHVLVAPLPEGQRVAGSRLPRRPGQDVVGAQLGHGHPVRAQKRVRGQQVVVRPMRDAHDRVRLPVADAIADPAEQAPPGAELFRPRLVADVEDDDGAGQGSGAMVVAGVRPRNASACTCRHSAGTRSSMAARREPSTLCTRTRWSSTSSSTPDRSTRCSSSSRPSSTHPLSRFSVTTPRLVPRAGTALTTTRTAARYLNRTAGLGGRSRSAGVLFSPQQQAGGSRAFTWYERHGQHEATPVSVRPPGARPHRPSG